VLEPLFHADSYGYRPGKSALDAVRTSRRRNWEYDWVLDVDIRKFFDTIDHGLLMKAVERHCSERWMVLYIERWLKAPVELADGRMEANQRGTPQGGVISPLLANLYLHYAFDMWMQRENPQVRFERYADDVIIHCRGFEESETLKKRLQQRLEECGLSLHSEKTQVVYCKDSGRHGTYPDISYKFLGYTFRPRAAKNQTTGACFTGFLPAASRDAQKALLQTIKEKRLRQVVKASIEVVAAILNPTLRGWLNYYRHFCRSALRWISWQIDRRLTRWARNKYRWNCRRAARWLIRLKCQQPRLFAHWELLSA
jgi:RNA-directed DNA polymerase